ncbi:MULTISPECIES: hydrolytic protein [unclassified Streptomyces]|uniref:COG1470 family protein n=1 Tax=unclassified Streptomyces TaxID=2593676 RepID=UPI0037F7402C
MPPVTVTPGGEATTTLTVRNDGDIVEAYTLETVGDCAAWSTVEPARVSLYPGTSETVTVRLAPPRSPEVRAGDIPLGVRVLPAEHPELVRVPETTVHVEAFRELRRELQPRRRRGWLGARYRVAVRNQGNTAADVAFTGRQAGEELRFGFTPSRPRLEPGESTEVRLRVRTGKVIWFGKPVTWPFQVDVAHAEETASGEAGEGQVRPPSEQLGTGQHPSLEGEFVQLSVFPKWLLAVLAALLALLIAWFALVRPAVQSTAKQAANDAVSKPSPNPSAQQGGTPGTGAGSQGKPSGGGAAGSGGGSGSSPEPGTVGGGQQSSATVDVQTDGGATNTGVYKVPAGKVFGITDIVVANFQGDEGVLTITFGDRKITTIALETFRNQDYHWVTPIEIPENATVTAKVTCAKPGTPATGKQASGCDEVLNVSGVLSDVKR